MTLVLGLLDPGVAEDEPRNTSAGYTAAPQPSSQPDSASAMTAARASGVRVEDLSKRDEETQVFANPDGTWTAETASEPIRVRDSLGHWHDIDTTLIARGGGYAPAYADSDLVLSAGGGRTFAELHAKGHDLAWKWNTDLPAPIVQGDTATYEGVGPGDGDLVVTATSTGFTYDMVLNERPTAPIVLTTPVVTDGAEIQETVTEGVAITTDAGSPIVAAPHPVMWDAAKDGRGEPVNVQPVRTDVTAAPDGGRVILSPDQTFLEDPTTEYPVVVDPGFTTKTTGDMWIENVDRTDAQPGSEYLRVGSEDGGTHRYRTYLDFKNSTWNGTHVTSATLRFWNYHSGSCGSGAVRASMITSDWQTSNLRWDNQPSVDGSLYDDYSQAHGNTNCAPDDADFNVTKIVDAWAHGTPNNGIRVKAVDETSTNTFREYRSVNYDLHPDWQPKLIVTYNTVPKASSLVVSPGGSDWTDSPTPTASALISDGEDGPVTAAFRLLSGPDVVWSAQQSVSIANGSARASVGVPADVLTIGSTYTLSVSADDGTDVSEAPAEKTFTFVPSTTVAPAGPCGNGCTPLADLRLLDSSATNPLAPGETRVFSGAIPGVDAGEIDRLAVNLTVENATGSGGITVYDPDFPMPRRTTLAWTSTPGAQGTAEVGPSVDGQLAIHNDSATAIGVRISAYGWYGWVTPDEQALDDAENGPTTADLDPVNQATIEDVQSDDVQAPLSVEDFARVGASSDDATRSTTSCEDDLDGSSVCMSTDTDGLGLQRTIAEPVVSPDYATDATGVEAARIAISGCPRNAGWTLTGRYNACRVTGYHMSFWRLVDGEKILKGTADFDVDEKVDLDRLTLTVQHKWRFIYRGGWGWGSELHFASENYCDDECFVITASFFDALYAGNAVGTWSSVAAKASTPSIYGTVTTQLLLDGTVRGAQGPSKHFGMKTATARCDARAYISGTGCAFSHYVPTFTLSRSGLAPESADHIAHAQAVLGGHPGSKALGGRPLSRHYWTGPNMNRREALKKCRAYKVTGSCDEYPFASTDQGCAFGPCHVRGIPLADNRLSGAWLGSFYNRKRLLAGDKFWVRVIS